jgi:hypothetical protein
MLVPHVKLEFSHNLFLNSGTPLAHFAPAAFKRRSNISNANHQNILFTMVVDLSVFSASTHSCILQLMKFKKYAILQAIIFEIFRHRRGTRRQTEKTNLNL